jgi:TolB-like protein
LEKIVVITHKWVDEESSAHMWKRRYDQNPYYEEQSYNIG